MNQIFRQTLRPPAPVEPCYRHALLPPAPVDPLPPPRTFARLLQWSPHSRRARLRLESSCSAPRSTQVVSDSLPDGGIPTKPPVKTSSGGKVGVMQLRTLESLPQKDQNQEEKTEINLAPAAREVQLHTAYTRNETKTKLPAAHKMHQQ